MLFRLDDDSFSQVSAFIPKFGIRSAPKINEILEKNGMGLIFNQEQCDLSGIAPINKQRENLFIGDIIHQAMIEMTAPGTKAAAATAFVGVHSTSIRKPQVLTAFVTTRPFLFFIISEERAAILFMGHVVALAEL